MGSTPKRSATSRLNAVLTRKSATWSATQISSLASCAERFRTVAIAVSTVPEKRAWALGTLNDAHRSPTYQPLAGQTVLNRTCRVSRDIRRMVTRVHSGRRVPNGTARAHRACYAPAMASLDGNRHKPCPNCRLHSAQFTHGTIRECVEALRCEVDLMRDHVRRRGTSRASAPGTSIDVARRPRILSVWSRLAS